MKVSIVYFSDIYDVNGVNFVTNFFVKGRVLFNKYNISLNHIFSLNGIADLSNLEEIKIGNRVNSPKYKITRNFRTRLSKIFNSKHKAFARFKIERSYLEPARRVIKKHIELINKEDCILFQDIFTAYFFLIHKKRNRKLKTILLLHCDKEPFEQLLSYYPSLIGTDFEKKLEKIKRIVYKEISKVIFLSEKTFLYNQASLGSKGGYIYNGIVDLPVLYKDSDCFNIVCLGSITGHKGQELIIKALSNINDFCRKNIKLYFIGGGPKLEELKKLTQFLKLSDNIVFYGIRNDIPELLQKMDLMILPSKSEGMPISILEGMRQGMYILATKVGAIPEMLTPDFGDFVERNPEDIKEKIMKVYQKSPKEKSDYKRAARSFFLEHFTHEKMIQSYSLLIKNLLNEE